MQRCSTWTAGFSPHDLQIGISGGLICADSSGLQRHPKLSSGASLILKLLPFSSNEMFSHLINADQRAD